MPKNRLTERKIQALKPKINSKGVPTESIRGDGDTLFLRVRPGGSKQFVQIINMHKRRKEVGLGAWPIVRLEEARAKARENRLAVKRGGDPFVKKTKFAEALEAVIELQRGAWRGGTEQSWRSSMDAYALPRLGDMDVEAIKAGDVFACLEPIWATKHKTASAVKQRINTVMLWAIAKSIRTDNPVEAVTAALPKQRTAVTHHTALPWQEVPSALATIMDVKTHIGTRLAFVFLVLTAARSNEVRQATWNEVNTSEALWTIPATKMKAGAEHIVPLSKAAISVLERAKAMDTNRKNLVFPSARGKMIADAVLGRLPRNNNVAAVPHGFRSSFRDWAAENDYERDVAEAALAHTVRNAVEAAYRRTSFLQKRRAMMEAWGEFCEVKMDDVGGDKVAVAGVAALLATGGPMR